MPDSDTVASEPPRSWVEAFFDSEAEIRGVLEDVREAHLLGDHETVREKLRAFAQAENGIFRIVALVVLDAETFYTDLEEQYAEETPPTEELQAIGSEFDRLADDLELVFSEQMNQFQNPRPGLRRGFRYSEETKLPRLDYDVYSGEVKLCQFVHPPSQALVLVQSILYSTRKLLEQVDANGDPIAEGERERIANMHDHLSEELAEMEAYVEAPPEDERDTELDPFDDWSFY
jgi:hypothetical protein